MISWLKGLGLSVKIGVVALLAALAVMAAKRQKATSRKWQQKAVDVEDKNVETGTLTAAAANTKAKLHDAKSDEIKAKAVARIEQMGGKDEDIADILDQFRRSS